MVLDRVNQVPILVIIFEFEHSHSIVHVSTSIQVVFLLLMVVVLLEDVVQSVSHVLVSQLQIEAFTLLKIIIHDTLLRHEQE